MLRNIAISTEQSKRESAIAEGYYGIPDAFKFECEKRLPEDMLAAIRRFRKLAGEAGSISYRRAQP